MININRFNENLNDFEFSIGVSRFYTDIVNFFKTNHSSDLNILNVFKLEEYSFFVKIGKYELNIKFEKDTDGNLNGAEFGFYNDKNLKPYIKLYYNIGESIIDVLQKNESNMKHEITHYFDYIKRNYNLSVTSEILKKSGDKSYYNTTEEINAYFIQACTDIISMLKVNRKKILTDFNTFKKYFIIYNKDILQFYNNLTDVNKKSIDKRIYSFFDRVKNIVNFS